MGQGCTPKKGRQKRRLNPHRRLLKRQADLFRAIMLEQGVLNPTDQGASPVRSGLGLSKAPTRQGPSPMTLKSIRPLSPVTGAQRSRTSFKRWEVK